MNFVKLDSSNAGIFTKDILGNKGYNLIELTKIDVNIPQGIIFFTNLCREYYDNGKKINDALRENIISGIHVLEESTEKYMGDVSTPLIISVRSGAPVSMPGMLDTILNVGINEQILCNCNQISLYYSYLHFIKSYAQIVKNIKIGDFNDIGEANRENLLMIIKRCKLEYQVKSGESFPEDVLECVINCVIAIFESWNNDNAVLYRKNKCIPDNLYTAVILQEMVFGNYNSNSGTGVIFSQNPITGEKELYGEYLPCKQGEDIVSGVSNPISIEQLKQENYKVYSELNLLVDKIERHFNCPQDIEFTYENGILYILQTRDMHIKKLKVEP